MAERIPKKDPCGRTPRDFLRAASKTTGVPMSDICDVSIRRSSKSNAPSVRRALILAMRGYFPIADAARILKMKTRSIEHVRSQGVTDEAMALAKQIEAAAFGNLTASTPANNRPHPGYSKITASGFTIRRDPNTGEVLFHPHDKAAFQHLIGA